VSYEQLVVG